MAVLLYCLPTVKQAMFAEKRNCDPYHGVERGVTVFGFAIPGPECHVPIFHDINRLGPEVAHRDKERLARFVRLMLPVHFLKQLDLLDAYAFL
jgi:hypothetical protein